MGFVEDVEGELIAITTDDRDEDAKLIELWQEQHGAEKGPFMLAGFLLDANRRFKQEIRRLEAVEADRAAQSDKYAHQMAADILEKGIALLSAQWQDMGEQFVGDLARQAASYRSGSQPSLEGSLNGDPEVHQCQLPPVNKSEPFEIWRCPLASCAAQWRLYPAGSILPDQQASTVGTEPGWEWRRIDIAAQKHDCLPPGNVDAYRVGEPWFCSCRARWHLVASNVPAHDAAVVPAHWVRG